VPGSAWKKLVEWYGGGPEFPREVINNNQIELYPKVLYGYLCGTDGSEVKESADAFTISCKKAMKDIRKLLKNRFNKYGRTSVWYRLRNTYNWIKVEDYNKTVEEIEMFDGDSLMLEVMIDGKWPRENVVDKPSSGFNIGDDIDIYIEKVNVGDEK
jgi:hypothetical protein